MSSSEFIRGLQNQETWAFEELYRCHKELVYNTAFRYVKNNNDAEELTQDVFVTAIRKIHQFNGGSKVGTWLVSITINKSINFLKGVEKYRHYLNNRSDIGEEQNQPIELTDPSSLIELKETKKMLFRAIKGLPDKQKTVFTLRYIEELSQLETAEVLGISIGAVESLVHRAKIKLKIRLQDQHNI